MGRILGYVVLVSNLSIVLGAEQYPKPSPASNHGREKQENVTEAVKQHFPEEQNGFFNRKFLQSDLQERKRTPPSKQMLSSLGLHYYSSDDFDRSPRKRNFLDRNGKFSELARKNVLPGFSQGRHSRRNSKNFYSLGLALQKASHNNSLNHQTKRPDDFSRRYQREGRHSRYHPRHSPKICDPCNSVPWVPLLKVSDSYRQQRTHVTELHPAPQQNFNFDYHAYASNAHNILLPPVPLAPPIFDGTISSSFGLPIGNIPTSHGLLAPINHLATEFNKYPINTIDYSSSFNYYSPHGLLENNNFPELSPVPIVPIHDSGQFYQLDSTIPDLAPPSTKGMSNVVLTISEDPNPAKGLPFNHKNPDADPSSESGAVDSHQHSHSPAKEQNRSKDLGGLEIVKSIPLAEFTSSVHFPQQQQLPLYPPLQSEFSGENEFHAKKTNSDYPTSSLSSLVPPPKKVENDISFGANKSGDDKSEYLGQATAPKPLTSPSLSWLFSHHTAPPSDSKSTASVSSFATDAKEIASIVNNELRPVSSHPLLESSPTEQSVGVSKSKKIQIIIPYTTKSKNGHDNNALESVQHEVFQPPVMQSTNENNSPRDFAASALPPSAEQPPRQAEANRGKKTTDRTEGWHEAKSEREGNDPGFLGEMRHIIATNLRELLREEIEKSKKDQNYPLQNNIDNWTALEYSNHKTVGTKAPKEIIAQALAVTSIPGTSISHLLLPSKKIPNEYFVTTPIPIYDEPHTALYKAENSSVNSSPFTAKPYATTNVYNPTRGRKENDKRLSQSQVNHERNYTEVGVGRVNIWGRLNENLVLPEARSRTRTGEQTTASARPDSLYSPSMGSEKVQIVTPVSVSSRANQTTAPFRRTTRHTRTTETPTWRKPFRKPSFLNKVNSTKLEQVFNLTSPFIGKSTYDSTTVRTANSSHSVPGVVEVKNNAVPVEESVVETVTMGQELSRLSGAGEHFSINDIFPFRNKELPWESSQNSSQPALRTGRQRKSLIKQVNLQRQKAVVGSS